MMDKVFEIVDATDATIKQLFAEAGTPVSRAFAYAEDKVEFLNRVGRALDLVEATSRGDVGINRLAEAMGTSDFPLLMGVALEQVMVGAYRSWPTSYRDWAMVSTVPDFRDAARYEGRGWRRHAPGGRAARANTLRPTSPSRRPPSASRNTGRGSRSPGS